MCGIAGVLGRERSEEGRRAASRMLGSLAHRGPDGLRLEREGEAFLGHARLSIIDLDGGWQPLRAAGSTIIGNGEIYNYRELAREFSLEGVLATGSDFEPLLHIYALEGEKAFQRLRGMYAFCLLGADGRTWLVRDPFGIKPLYTLERPDGVWFASEPQALWAAAGRRAQPPLPARAELLNLNYVVSPLEDEGGVSRIPPGAVVEVRDGALVSRDARRLLGGVRTQTRTQTKLLAALDGVLEDAVRVHQRSDVPYGLFLSGGIDSASVAVMMARLNARPVTAYTCGFVSPDVHDERGAAERLARSLDLDWRPVSFDVDDFWRLAPAAAAALDDPTSDFAALPTLRLAEAAKEALTVVLTGEGGDELFAGYSRYRRALRPAILGGRPAEPRPHGLGGPEAAKAALAAWRRAAACAEPSGLTPLQRAQARDIATWLPQDLLLKIDRCLMAHGLEGRTPFLDPEVAAFVFALPDRFKVRRGHGKWLLRRWLTGVCPQAEPWSRKRGFTVPVAGFIESRLGLLKETIPGASGLRGLVTADEARAVFSEVERQDSRWPLLFTALWWAIHVEGATPDEAADTLFGGS